MSVPAGEAGHTAVRLVIESHNTEQTLDTVTVDRLVLLCYCNLMAQMTPYPLSLQLGMKRFHGHIFLAPEKLYFVCSKMGGAWAAAIGQSLGGLVGGAIAAAASPKPGEAPPEFDEAALEKAVAENDGSMIMEAPKIEMIKHTMWLRLIRFDGKKYGLPNGLSKPLKAALGEWAKTNNVKTKGKGLG